MPDQEIATQLPDLLRTDEAAAYLRCTPYTLRKFIAQGLLPVVRIGGLRRIRRSDLENLPSRVATP